MATIKIVTNTTNVPTNSSIVIGDEGRVNDVSLTIPQEPPPESSRYHKLVSTVYSTAGKLVISHRPQSFDEEVYKRWNWAIHAQLARLVEKNLVIVTLDGAVQTAANIRAAHTPT